MSAPGASLPQDLRLPLPGGLKMLFRRIPAGSFMMGSRGYEADEEPRRRVVIPRDFYLGKFVVTQAEWRALAEATPALREGVEKWELPTDHMQLIERWVKKLVAAGGTAFTTEQLGAWLASDPSEEARRRLFLELGQWSGEWKPEGAAGAEPSEFKGDRRPVEQVSWDDSTAWLVAWREWVLREWPASWMAERLREGWELRLPWEVEWEYACRAGSETEYWNGDGEAALAEVGW